MPRWLIASMLLLIALAAASALYLLSGGGGDTTDQAFLPSTKGTVLVMARADAEAEIGSIQPGELAPPPGAEQETGLRIMMVGPQGAQERPRQAVAVFDRKVVALGALDDPSLAAPISCGPGLAGRARWAGTTTAVWLPEGGRFPLATEVRCTIPAGITALDEASLEQEISFSFQTQRPRLERSLPREDQEGWDPERPILLVFNQAVDPAAVAAAVTLVGPDSRTVPLTGSRPEDDEESWMLPPDLERAVHLSGSMARDTEYTLTLPAAMKALEGDLGMEETQSWRFRTIPPAAVTEVEPTGQGVDPEGWITVRLATRTEAEELNDRITIEPAPPAGWSPAGQYASSSWSHSAPLAPMTTYKVTVAPGATDVHGQVMEEGFSWTFTTGHYSSFMDMASGTQVIPITGPITLPIRHRNLTSLDVGVARLSPQEWATRARDPNAERHSPSRSLEITDEVGVTDRTRSYEVDLTQHLSDGHGFLLVEASSPDITNWRGETRRFRTLVQVTDLGVTVKSGAGGVTAWVSRLSDGLPVDDAAVDVWVDGERAWSGRTDSDGVAVARDVLPESWSSWSQPVHVMATVGSDRALASGQWNERLSTWEHGVNAWGEGHSAELRTHAYTERGVYRRGETAHMALTARIANARGLSRPERGEVSWSCEDARSTPLGSGTSPLDRHSAAHWDLTLPEEMALGAANCHVKISAAGLETSTHIPVQVRAYRAPAFRVDVATPDSLTAGDRLEAVGHGRFLFGAPMVDADASWRIYSQEITPNPPGWDNFSFGVESGNWWESDWQTTTRLASGEGKLDGGGRLVVEAEIPVTEEPSTRNLTVEIGVTDLARQEIANRADVVVHPAEVYPGIRMRSGLGTAGEASTVELVAVTPEGLPREAISMEVTLSRRTWDTIRQKGMDGRWSWVSTHTDQEVDSRTVQSADEPVGLQWTPEEAGYHVIKVTARDRARRASVSETGFYVTGPGASWPRSDDNMLELVPDRREYSPGDVARVMVQAPRPGLMALVTVEREGVLDRRVLKLETTSDTIDIPIGEDAVPNLFVSVVLVEEAPPPDGPDGGRPNWYLGYRELTVSAADRRLDVAIETGADTYRPRDEVEARVKVTRNGEPVPGAHVVLWAVDHGVLSLTGYQVPDASGTYFARHPLRVITYDTRTRILDRASYLAKGAEAGGGGGVDVRSRFVTTPLWLPALETGPDGTLTATFQLPDNLTTFRLMATVADERAFGAGDQELRVTRPLLARSALPRIMRTGDVALAGVVVHNNGQSERRVKVTASVTGIKLEGSPATVDIPAGEAVEVPFRLEAEVPGEASLEFRIDDGTDRDALAVTIPVVTPAPADVVATAGSTDGTATETILKVKDPSPGVGGLRVAVAPTIMGSLDGAVGYLLDYPWSCLEQTSSRLMAALLVRDLGLGSDRSEEALDDLVAENLARIEALRHPSGGYLTWPGDFSPSPLGTAYALETLDRAGVKPRSESVRFLRQFMAGKWVPRWWTPAMVESAQARVALALARLGKGDPGFNARLHSDMGNLSLPARAHLLEATSRTSRNKTRMDELVQALEGAMVVDSTVATVRDPSPYAALWSNELTATAATVAALAHVNPDHPLLPRLARGLTDTRKGGRWGNTYTTQAALHALHVYRDAVEGGGGDPPGVKVAIGGGLIIDTTLDSPEGARAEVPIDEEPFGELTFSTDRGRIYYEARLAYGRDELPPRDEGFTLTRSYRTVEGTGGRDGVTPGALVRVDLRVVTHVDRTDVVVSDPLPAGLEPVDSFFRTTALGTMEHLEQDEHWDVFNHKAVEDAEVMLYASWMPAGIHVFSYLARATSPGIYSMPAARVEEMYRPEIYGRTRQGRFVVGATPVTEAGDEALR